MNEFTQTRRGDKTEENTEILAEPTRNDVSIRVAGSSRRDDRYKDGGWAGCELTRRSTSGEVIMHGSHFLLHTTHGLKVVWPSRVLRPN